MLGEVSRDLSAWARSQSRIALVTSGLSVTLPGLPADAGRSEEERVVDDEEEAVEHDEKEEEEADEDTTAPVDKNNNANEDEWKDGHVKAK